MPVNQTELLAVVQLLSEQENLRVTVKESMKGAAVAGGGALVGGLLGGPVGLAIGGTLGSVCAAWRGSGKFKSVAALIMEDLNERQRGQLVERLQRALQDIHYEDVIMLTGLVLGNAGVQQMVLAELGTFIRSEMGLAITW